MTGDQISHDELVERLVRLFMPDGEKLVMQDIPSGKPHEGTQYDLTVHEVDDLETLESLDELRQVCRERREENPQALFAISPRDELLPKSAEVRQQIDAWLDQPNPAFGDRCPRELLESDEEVERNSFASFVTGLEQGSFS